MEIKVVGKGNTQGKSLDRIRLSPEFRKATRNMMLAYLSIEEAFQVLPLPVLESERRNFALVLGSNHGEIDTTVQFLEQLDTLKVARPLLFQNSLHNSTVGFLAMKLGITGPTFAVSNQQSTAENCLEIASTLLEAEEASFCLVTLVESPANQLALNSYSLSPKEESSTLLLTTGKTAKKFGIEPISSTLQFDRDIS